MFSDLQPTTKKVCKMLKFGIDLTLSQKEVANHLKKLIIELDESRPHTVLLFCTGSDLILTDSIHVEFVEITEFTIKQIGRTCGNILCIADT